jgi:hypothetical protein
MMRLKIEPADIATGETQMTVKINLTGDWMTLQVFFGATEMLVLEGPSQFISTLTQQMANLAVAAKP